MIGQLARTICIYRKKFDVEDIHMGIKLMLDENFPSIIFIANIFISSVLAFLLLILQIFAIVFKTPLYQASVGIWTGLFIFIINICTIGLRMHFYFYIFIKISNQIIF